MSASYYAAYAPPLTNPWSPYAQQGSLAQRPATLRNSFSPGTKIVPRQDPEGSGIKSQSPPTNQNTNLPDGNNARKNYWLGLGGAAALWTGLAATAAWRSGQWGTLLGKAFNPLNWKIILKGAHPSRYSILQGYLTLRGHVKGFASVISKALNQESSFKFDKISLKEWANKIHPQMEAFVKSTQDALVVDQGQAKKMDELLTTWTHCKTHLEAQDSTAETVTRKLSELKKVFDQVGQNLFKPTEKNTPFKKALEEYVNNKKKLVSLGFSNEDRKWDEQWDAIKKLPPERQKESYLAAKIILRNWKKDIKAIYGSVPEALKTLTFDPKMSAEQIEASRKNIMENLPKLDYQGRRIS